MSARLPTVRITPEDVLAFAKRSGQKPSLDDVREWLRRHRRDLEQVMRAELELRLEKILQETSGNSHPDPVFNERYQLIDEAVMTAADTYAERLGLEFHSSSNHYSDLLAVTRRLLANEDPFQACIAYEQQFAPRGTKFSINEDAITHRTYRTHIYRTNGIVKAETVEGPTCSHAPHEFFTPNAPKRMQ